MAYGSGDLTWEEQFRYDAACERHKQEERASEARERSKRTALLFGGSRCIGREHKPILTLSHKHLFLYKGREPDALADGKVIHLGVYFGHNLNPLVSMFLEAIDSLERLYYSPDYCWGFGDIIVASEAKKGAGAMECCPYHSFKAEIVDVYEFVAAISVDKTVPLGVFFVQEYAQTNASRVPDSYARAWSGTSGCNVVLVKHQQKAPCDICGVTDGPDSPHHQEQS